MKVVEFKTREEWLEWRKGGLGSSDSPIVMGVSPWKTPLKLYQEKISTAPHEEEGSYITDLGNEFEGKVRALFETWEGKSFSPCNIESEEFPFLRVSLDGAASDGSSEIIEIKLLGLEDWELVKSGKVPEKYKWQVQKQLMVTGASTLYFLGYLYEKGVRDVNPKNLISLPVKPDMKMFDQLFKAESIFWNDNVLKRKPPVASDKDYTPLTGMSPIMQKWIKLEEAAKKIAEKQDALKEQILEECKKRNHPRYVCSGYRIRQESRVGAVDYSQIEAIQKMTQDELDKYRKPGSTSWKFEKIKEKK